MTGPVARRRRPHAHRVEYAPVVSRVYLALYYFAGGLACALALFALVVIVIVGAP